MARVMITGASGYIGRRLAAAAHADGLDVVAAVRDPSRLPVSAATTARSFDLARPQRLDDLLDGVDAVVHLAAIIHEDSRPAGASEDLNVSGTRSLLEAARRHGVGRFVFLSSQSAAQDAPTRYGRSKWHIEQLLDGPGETAVRTGLVCGGPPRGLYGMLLGLSRRSPLLPVIRAGAPLYPIHVDDLCAGLLAQLRGDAPPPRLSRLAAPRAIRFDEFIRVLARCRAGLRVRLLPIPAAPVAWIARLLPVGLRERVMGLVALRPMEPGPSLPDAVPARGLRDAVAALETEGLRRRYLGEARALMRYTLGGPPPSGAFRRYARAIALEADSTPLDLSRAVQRWPCLLRAFEPAPGDGGLFRRRLGLATRIVEMTPAGAAAFHEYRGRPLVLTVLSLAWLVAVEAVLLPLRALAGRLRARR